MPTTLTTQQQARRFDALAIAALATVDPSSGLAAALRGLGKGSWGSQRLRAELIGVPATRYNDILQGNRRGSPGIVATWLDAWKRRVVPVGGPQGPLERTGWILGLEE